MFKNFLGCKMKNTSLIIYPRYKNSIGGRFVDSECHINGPLLATIDLERIHRETDSLQLYNGERQYVEKIFLITLLDLNDLNNYLLITLKCSSYLRE